MPAPHDSGPAEPTPSRPGWKTLIFVVCAILAIEATYNWSEVSEFAHLPQIAHSLGLG